jgi:hypothetical protein
MMLPQSYPYRGLLDENGVAYGVKHVQNKIRTSSMPYTMDIAEGNVTGHTAWSKHGYNAASGTSPETVWAGSTGLYPFLAAETQLTVESSNNVEDKAGGAGALTVYVNYLDDAFAQKTATATLNGTTPVNLSAADVYRVQNFRVATCGANGVPTGNLSLKAGGVTYGYIAAGFNKARTMVWTVPAGQVLYITQFIASAVGTKYARLINRANYDNKLNTVLARGMFMGYTEALLLNSTEVVNFDPPTRLPATTDLKIDVIAEAAGVNTSVQLRGWYETA